MKTGDHGFCINKETQWFMWSYWFQVYITFGETIYLLSFFSKSGVIITIVRILLVKEK